jgi:hypothetical protein
MIVLLDSGPVGLLTHPKAELPQARACTLWVRSLAMAGAKVLVPGIIDYEIRRELARIRSTSSLTRLDALRLTLGFDPVDTAVLTLAAQLWAAARQKGVQTAHNQHLDIDMILISHALLMKERFFDDKLVVATTNVQHLGRFVDAREWGSFQTV